MNYARINAAKKIFSDERVIKIFVSNFLKKLAEQDMGSYSLNSKIIHNFIDTEFFSPVKSKNYKSNKVLLISSFGGHNYANDIALDAIKKIAGSKLFQNTQFTICGFGKYYSELTRWAEFYENVTLINRYLNKDEMLKLYSKNNIFLAPTRFDTQGVTLGEAMSSALACITNESTAIPEFVDKNCALLVPENNPNAFASALKKLLGDAELKKKLGLAARSRVKEQCGYEATLSKELDTVLLLNREANECK